MPVRSSRKTKRRIAGLISVYLLIIFSALFYTVSVYKRAQFGDAHIDEMIFYLTNGLADATTSTFREALWQNVLLFLTLSFLLLLPVVDFYRGKIRIKVNLAVIGSKRKLKFNPSKISLKSKLIYAAVVFLIGVWFLLSSFHILSYVKSLTETTQIFEQSYIAPKEVAIKFPDQKRNLIYIFMESMENTVASIDNGGQMSESRIPELEKIALDPQNVSFSNLDQGLGGALPANGTTWTVGGMTAQSAGLPLKNDLFGAGQNEQGKFKYFLPGAYTLGDVLEEEGYNQSFVMGSMASFGGRDKLLHQHGKYTTLDLKHMIEEGDLPADYKVWWGYEDRKMFDFAKDEAERLASKDVPFNLQLLTADTHFTDGYLDSTCLTPYEDQYDNVHACSSAKVAAFVEWVQQQPFGKNTTIILSGDHLGMQTEYYDDIIQHDGYQRTIYNAFINPAVRAKRTKGRLFTSFDMYPSTLAALGAKVPGDRLGLGVNLFSDKATVLEQYGNIGALNDELGKRSEYYDKNIISGINGD